MKRNVRLVELERSRRRAGRAWLILAAAVSVYFLAAYADERAENVKLRDVCELRSP